MKNICVIVNKYPNPIEPNVLVFVQQLVWSMSDKGMKVSVICPVPVNLNPKYLSFPYKKVEYTENNNKVEVYHPKFIGFGQANKIFGKSLAPLTTNLFTKAVKEVIENMEEKPDVVYGHFITPAGISTARVGRYFNIPAFVAHGEATTNSIHQFGAENAAIELKSLAGAIAVSSQNKGMLISTGIVGEEKIGVFPNAYRPERFYKRDRKTAREKFGFNEEDFIVGFVGSFDNRKGILRLEQAVESLDGVKFACAGKGKLVPTSDKCVFAKPINNEELPYFYSAVDIFVLPTLHEGCCNAIIEAMACGKPIISSDRSFNDEILDETCSIKINPEDVDEIKNAVKKLYEDKELRNKLSEGSFNMAKMLTLEKRASNIVDFINKRMDR